MEATTSGEDVLVVLQTESGEQIALPMSALPNDFVPGDSGQIIMVESGLDEQQQEIVVESSDLTGHLQTSSSDLVSLQHVDPNLHIPSLDLVAETNEATNSDINNDNISYDHSTEIITTPAPTTSYAEKPSGPRTYSKSSAVKSYAPTCGPARIYQQCQPVPAQHHHHQQQQQEQDQHHHQQDDQLESENFQNHSSSNIMIDNVAEKKQHDQTENDVGPPNETEAPAQPEEKPVVIPHVKQKRKEPLLLRPINDDDDMKLEYIVMKEPSPPVQEPEVKRRRKEHRTSTKKTKKSKHEPQPSQNNTQQQTAPLQQQSQQKQETSLETTNQSPIKREHSPASKKHQEQPKEQQQQQQQATPKQQTKQFSQQQQPQSERRTRLSNACRVATGKMYRCNDCDFSTDRINNIVLHVKEQCSNKPQV